MHLYLFVNVYSPLLGETVRLKVLKECGTGVGRRQMRQEVGHPELVVVDLDHRSR